MNILSQICSNSFKGFCYHKLTVSLNPFTISVSTAATGRSSAAQLQTTASFALEPTAHSFFFLLWIGKSVPTEPLCATVMAHINSTTAFLDGQHHLIQLFLACCVSGNALVESLPIILFSRNIFGSCGIGAS